MTEATPAGFVLAPAPVEAPGAVLRGRYGLFAGGDWCEAAGGSVASIDPANERPLAEVGRASPEDVERAVRGARRAYDKYWRKLRPAERAKHLFRLARAVGERSGELALVQSLDAGTPIRYGREHDLPQTLATFFAYAGWADKLPWAVRAGERTRPLGVIAAIGAGHSPALDAACAIAPALAAGNAVVFVPSEATPLTALSLAQACLDADLPPGVVNIVTGDARTRAALLDHGDVDAVTLRGPRRQCIEVERALAGMRKRAVARPVAGGSIFVFEDAPLEAAVEGIVRSVWLQRGPFAPDVVRLFVQESVLAETLDLLEERLRGIRHGDPLDENTDLGPLETAERRDAVAAFVRRAVADGASALASDASLPERGFWYAPTVLRDVPGGPGSAAPCLPAMPLTSFRTAREALDRAKGLGRASGAGVWTSSGQLAAFVAERLPAAAVWCNAYERFDVGAHDGGASGLRDLLHT